MSREIKFRAWCPDEGKMYKSQTPDADSCYTDSLTFLRETFGGWSCYEWQQYTGLKDKNGNGVEIYEGDIIAIHNFITRFKRGIPDGFHRKFKVWYNRYTWAIENEWIYQPLSEYDTHDGMPYDIEVIGNIYENPELLK